ncbi:MAG: hypothetical protein C0615_04080 [Desulfuromonas sp.]|nr:MAG: hypothetical protein C0615_04080 [Desulfuromonas sp.]
MNILLVNPFQYFSINKHLHRRYPVPGLTLPYIASLIPAGHSISIIDEARENVNYDHPADLICITTQTVNAHRAYTIADRFRKRGKMVVLGGPHASAMPDEAQQHCDAVAVGNAETIMAQIVNDAEHRQLRSRYHNSIPEQIPTRARGYVNGSWQTSILASRGCELNCSFCSMQNIFGDFYLQRNIAEVLRDIEKTKTDYITFVDDNFYGASKKANAYYDQIIQKVAARGISWLAQVRLPILTDNVLSKFRDNNCAGVFIGFESINPKNVNDVGKKLDADYFINQIQRIHDKGLGVVGSFIFGFDEDTPETIERTVDFCIESRMELTAFSVLTPYPGTKVYSDFEREGRILSRDWRRYDSDQVVFQPNHFTPQQLETSMLKAAKKFYSVKSILSRMKRGMNYDPVKLYLVPNLLRKYSLMTM